MGFIITNPSPVLGNDPNNLPKKMSVTESGVVNVSVIGSLANLLDSVTATGAGDPVSTQSYKNFVFEVWGTATTFSIKMQVVGPSGVARDLKIWDELNNAFLSGNITTAGVYSVSIPSQMSIQANVISVSGGNVNLEGGML